MTYWDDPGRHALPRSLGKQVHDRRQREGILTSQDGGKRIDDTIGIDEANECYINYKRNIARFPSEIGS